MNENYQITLDRTLDALTKEGRVPSLLLHSCCAPCSSYVLEYLSHYFNITVFYYNPNLDTREEYERRTKEQERLIREMPLEREVKLIVGDYDTDRFHEISRGLEDVPEGGERCFKCYRLRLEEAAREAKNGGYDFFTTTLSISPLKNSKKLNEIGALLADEYGVSYLFSDFKKRNGYKRSCELSTTYSLYRQNYCGCEYSKAEALRREKNKTS